MLISQYIEILKDLAPKNVVNNETTCDTVKSGDVNKEISRVAVSMFATPEVINQAAEWGANFLIVHEPSFYEHMDINRNSFLANEKTKLLEEKNLTVFRFHDYAHSMEPDLICEGELKYINLNGVFQKGKNWAVNRFVLKDEITAKELADHLEKNLSIKHIRIAGCTDKKGKNISCCFGTPGHIAEELAENDFVLTGEICEWQLGEIARDYAQFGYNKAILVMGHIGSERAGMMLLAEKLEDLVPEIPVKYFECGEVYSYTH